jgi:hypothetical protein
VQQSDRLHRQRAETQRQGEGHAWPDSLHHALDIKPSA